jgi:Fur family ferric uptake transcriptional regulator
VEKTKQIFRAFINNKNLRYTEQRDIIIEQLYRNKGHFTPDEFCDLIKVEYPDIGKATVYRTLKLLEEAKITSRIEFGDMRFRYELNADRDHHDHLICERCKKSVEVSDSKIESLQNKLAQNHGFQLTGHRLYLYGICEDCRRL